MKREYYNKAKLTQIILDLINLFWEMKKDGFTDKQSLATISDTIDILKYYLQFLSHND